MIVVHDNLNLSKSSFTKQKIGLRYFNLMRYFNIYFIKFNKELSQKVYINNFITILLIIFTYKVNILKTNI